VASSPRGGMGQEGPWIAQKVVQGNTSERRESRNHATSNSAEVGLVAHEDREVFGIDVASFVAEVRIPDHWHAGHANLLCLRVLDSHLNGHVADVRADGASFEAAWIFPR